MTQVELRGQWEERVAAFRSSGQSVKAWCTANSLKPQQLWYWLRKDRPTDSSSQMSPSWLSVEIGDLRSGSPKDSLLIRVGQAVIEVQPGFNPTLLSDVVQVLTGLC